jgi:hypothetical protein
VGTPPGDATPARDDRPSARDYRRVWAQILPQTPAFKNRSAQLLAEFSNAVLNEEGWEAFSAAHPEAGDVLPTEPAG